MGKILILRVMLALTLVFSLGGYFGTSSVTAADGGWLSGWANRVRLTIDSSKVSANLTDFPVMIRLSSASGINAANSAYVIDALGNDSNRKKIAVTTADGVTECFVEIEKWDTAGKQAVLWVKVPAISASTNTVLYLYYDAGRADNTARVGDIGSVPGQNVWTNGFVGVWHMAESGSQRVGEYKDSTKNQLHGQGAGYGNTRWGTGTAPSRISTIMGDGQFFNGSTDYITVPDHDGFSCTTTGYLTASYWIQPTRLTYRYSSAYPSDPSKVNSWINAPLNKGGYPWEWSFGIGNLSPGQYKNQELMLYVLNPNGGLGDGAGVGVRGSIPLQVGDWIQMTGRLNNNNRNVNLAVAYPGRSSLVQDTYNGWRMTMENTNSPLTIGTAVNQWQMYEGVMDEIRISSVWRADAWVLADNHSNRDTLMAFGPRETAALIPAPFSAILPRD